MDDLSRHYTTHRDRFIEELKAAVRIPSISASPEHRGEVERCARHIREEMARIGLQRAEVLPTGGHPVVYGEWMGAPGRPTILVYGHFDVQPVDPLDEWVSPPFEPAVRDGRLWGRGVVDDKGQVYIHLKALEGYLAVRGGLPLNVKMIIEGEEEVGSAHLETFLEKNRARLACDMVVVSDTPMFKKGVPSICYGLRGLAYLQIDLQGPAHDLHSGSYGGAVANPANVLAAILAGLKDDKGRVTIPGFYDAVRPISPSERAALAALPFDPEAYRAETGVPALAGEEGYSVVERLWCRPTLDVNGMVSGFTGEGAKTIIPARASAKVSMRLVPDQDPETIADLFEEHVRRVRPPGVEVKVTRLHGGKPYLASTDHPAYIAAGRALEKGFGSRAVFIREGGSIPFVSTISEVLRRPCILVGFGLPDENAHAPNEWLDLDNFHKGIVSSAHLYAELATLPGGSRG